MKKVIPAKRTENVKHAIRDIVPIAQEVEKTGKKVIYLNIGDPMKFDYKTPEHIWRAINENKKKCEGYTNAIGNESTRQAVADYAKRMNCEEITSNDVIISVGGSESIILSLQALMNQGENIVLPRPGYSIYKGELNFLECEAKEYDLNEDDDWQADPESIRTQINEKTRGIVTINPNNPTGSVTNKKHLRKIIDIAGEYSLPIFSDETYDQLLYDGEEFTAMASIAKDVPIISFGSISKTHLAPGFRGGWMYKHDPEGALDNYFEAIKKLCRLRLSNVGPTEVAIEAALNGPQKHVQELMKKLLPRRNLTYKRLNEMDGLSCVKPKGAFYCFPKIELSIKSDKDFVLDLLKETGVLVVYGSGFGQKEGTNHFRVVFLPPEETLNSAFDKIEAFIKEKYL